MYNADLPEEEGYDVLETASAAEELAIMREHGTVHLLFSDIDMPGSMNGLDLAMFVHDRWPDVRLLLTSGNHRLADGQLPDHGEFLRKPLQQEALIERVRDLLRTDEQS